MPIDPSQPVTLKRHASIRGNFYHPREYRPGELPIELLTEEYVTQGTPEIPTFSPFTGAFEEVSITIGTETPNNEIGAYKTSTVILDPTPTRIQINTATVEAIASLNGISLTVAKKVVEERTKSPFTNLDNLKTRVALPKGVKWDTFTEQLLFDAVVVETDPTPPTDEPPTLDPV